MHGVKRIFYDGSLDDIIELSDEVSRRLRTVLRAQAGDKVEILTASKLASGEIGIIGKRGITVKIENARDVLKPDYSFTVYQCLAKREYMDFMVEKYAELGVTRLVPVISSRSLNALKDNTVERFASIAVEAALQSENEFVMEISAPIKLEKIKKGDGANILFHERVGKTEKPTVTGKAADIIIGPEGGFTDKETQYLVNAGFEAYTPINSVLKAETAAVLFAGLIRMEF